MRVHCVYNLVCFGRLAQMVERPLRMREAGGSIPPTSTFWSFTCVFMPCEALCERTVDLMYVLMIVYRCEVLVIIASMVNDVKYDV